MPAMMEKFSNSALTVLNRRYLKKDRDGSVVETPEEMFRRVAGNVARAELLFDKKADPSGVEAAFLSMMTGLEFLPNSPTLMNAGRRLQQLAACFVLPVEDSIDSIFGAVKNTALIHQSGGGTGFSFSRLRPASDIVGSTGGQASGPVSFMRVFNSATEAITQGGARRGANMGVLSVDHPDIVSFITAKDSPGEFTNFNLSVAVTEEFMEAVREDRYFTLTNPRNGKVTGRRKARELFGLIVESAWKTGEPGVLFMDRINGANPTPALGRLEATNPCGEQPLLPYEACNLGSINLSRMLKRNGTAWQVDYEKLAATVETAVRFLDNAIEASRYPVPEIQAMARGNRKIGLGVMGFADMLVRLRLSYAGRESLALAEKLMRFVQDGAWRASRALAAERGPFPNIKGSFFDRPGAAPVRNATTTTIAPTGSLSIIAGCSSGIEPLYSLCLARRVLGGEELIEFNPLVEEVFEEEGVSDSGLLEYLRQGGSLQSCTDVPEEIRRIFATAFDITPGDHVRVQAAFQKYTDNAVSKTINLGPKAGRKDVEKAFLLAHELGCKGVTVYRSGTREGQVLSCKDTVYC